MLKSLDVWSSLGLRGLVAFFALLPFAIVEVIHLRSSFATVVKAVLPVAFWFTLAITLQLAGAKQTSATNVGFLINTCVVLTPFVVWVFSGSRPPWFVWVSCLTCLVGIGMLSGGAPTSFNAGDALCLGSAVAFSGWIVALGKAMRTVNAPMLLTAFAWAAPAMIGLALGGSSATLESVASQIPNILFLGVVVGAGGFMLAARAQAQIAPCLAAICYSTEAVFGAIVAYIWLGESMSQLAFYGAGLTLSGMVLVQFAPQCQTVLSNAIMRLVRPGIVRSVFNVPG